MGTINVIFAAPRRTGLQPSRVMFVARPIVEDVYPMLTKARVEVRPVLIFLDKDKVGTIQPHDNALVITLRIEGYNVKIMMVD